MIPEFGIHGAIYATIISYFLALVLGLVVGRKIFPLPPPPPEIWKILCATGLMVIILLPQRADLGLSALTLQLVTGGMVYVIAIIVLNVAGCRQLLLQLIRNQRLFSNPIP